MKTTSDSPDNSTNESQFNMKIKHLYIDLKSTYRHPHLILSLSILETLHLSKKFLTISKLHLASNIR